MGDLDSYMRSFMTPMHNIDTMLFLGGLTGASSKPDLLNNNIQCIVQALSDASYVKVFPEFEYHRIQIDDHPQADMLPHLVGALRFIYEAHALGKNVFVHCAAGISRSTTIASAYMMAKYSLPFEEVLERIRLVRHCAMPNEGFQRQLRSLNIPRLRAEVGFD